MPSLPSHRCRRPLLCIILFIWTKSRVCEPALRGFIREELAHDQQQWPEWKEGNASSASSKNLESGTITAMDGNISSRETLRTSIRNFTTAYEPAEDHQPDGTMDATTDAIVRELQQTSVQAFINNYQSGTRFEDPGATGITGPTTHLPQVAHSPVTGGTGGVVFGGGAQSGTPGIAGGTFPTLGSESGVSTGGTGVGASPTGLGTTAGTIGGAPVGEGLVGPSGLPAPIVTPGGVGSVGGLGGGI